MIQIILVAVHVLVSLVLVLSILLHSGRGTGLSDMFGGGAGSVGGTGVVERNLDRITIVSSVAFGMTTVLLGLSMS